ncbi:MAG: PKD domain-containing protein, partial [Flavobacteriales bacterium]|nr:PKD domain-containing protein [Flavobacteriales bacterium]
MKILSTIILCLTLMLQGMSQCSPDSTIITPGAHPDTLADGFVGQSYSDTVTFVSPADTFIFGFNALVDSALITSVIGLPQGLSYTCLNANCATYNTYTGANYLYNCFEVSGIPTSVATNQTISVVYIAWISTFIGPTSITDTLELVISVQCPLPSPAFTETITTTTVAFTDGTANTPTSWLWDFGDGNTSTQQNPTHNYAVAGTYTVCLTATNSCGTDSVCKSVVTTCPIPDALFSF